MIDSELLLSIFVGVEGAHAFSAFMPSYFTVQKFAESDEDKKSLRSGYVPAVAFNIILGLIVSGLTKKALPLMVAAFVSLFMLAMYEGAIGKVNHA